MLVLMSEIYIHSESFGTLARMHLVIHMIHPSAHTLQLFHISYISFYSQSFQSEEHYNFFFRMSWQWTFQLSLIYRLLYFHTEDTCKGSLQCEN